MRHFIFRHCASVFTAAILFTLLPVHASDVRVPDDPNVLGAVVVEIQADTVRGWVNAKRGTEIVIPWYDDPLIATIERVEVTEVEEASKFMMVIAKVKAETIGNVVLTIGNDILTGDITLTGAITIDTESYRLRSLGGNSYSLVQFDTEKLMPTMPDTDDPDAVNIGLYNRKPLHPARPSIGVLPPSLLFKKLKAQHDWGPGIFESGLRIDILVAYSFDALDWAKANGYNNIAAEIVTMVENANLVLASSGIDTRLRLVGIAHVDYTVIDPSDLKTDRDNLRSGVGTLNVLHTLRDILRADLVSLLVFNGTEKCGDGKPGCGRSITSNNFAGPGDVPGSSLWEQDFASKGFSVVSVYHAFNAETFMHEIGHNLGAHHDWYAYLTATVPPADTADLFAHGWILTEIAKPARTIMSYPDLCKVHVPKLDCKILPLFSNPVRPMSTVRLGDPAPGEQPSALGPADNVRAINNMAQTVSSYRVAVPTP